MAGPFAGNIAPWCARGRNANRKGMRGRNRLITIARQATAGFLAGYGIVALLFYFCFLEHHWWSAAPHVPDLARGVVIPHTEHGSTLYFSAFQTTSSALLILTAAPTILLALFIVPKTVEARWHYQHQGMILVRGFAAGIVAALLILFVLGPMLVSLLNANGVIIYV